MLDVLAVFLAVDLVALTLVDLEGFDGVALGFDVLFERGLGHPFPLGHAARRLGHGPTSNRQQGRGESNFFHHESFQIAPAFAGEGIQIAQGEASLKRVGLKRGH
jgi:hypothetical protein